MTRLEELEAELGAAYTYLQANTGASVPVAIEDAIFKATGTHLSSEETDEFEGTPPGTFRGFIDWVLQKIKDFIKWVEDWWNEEDEE
ncbi:MAG: hypothetical protein COA36_16935 [Desulfotalea sp.]|nr:MAG: hypothetical protein COA36_16935 [Desulfotalea sp.]